MRYKLQGSFVASALLLLAMGTAQAAEATQDLIEKTFPAKAGGKLVIEADRGRLILEGGGGDQIKIQVERKVVRGSGSAAADLLARHKVEFEEGSSTLRVTADLDGKDSWGLGPQLQIEIHAILPNKYDVTASTAGGAILAKGLNGKIEIHTSGGPLELTEVGGTVAGKTSGGSITASKLDGSIQLSTSGGGIRISEVKGEKLQVSTSGGEIRLAEIEVATEAKTSGGGIVLDGVVGPLQASTSGGSIKAAFKGKPAGEVTLKSSAGGIQVALPADAGFRIDASTSAGSVKSDFETLVRNPGDRSHLEGEVNGGGPTLKLRTSAGSISIKKS